MEEELKDRLSFRHFVGLSSRQNPPDETVLVRFLAKLQTKQLNEPLFRLITAQLEQAHLRVKVGQWLLADATLVKAPFGVKFKGQDGNGDFTRRQDQVMKGYKAHLVKDQKSGLVKNALLTVASCHESGFLERLLEPLPQVQGLVADKGYAQLERQRQYRQQGIYYGVLTRRHRHQPASSAKQQKRNRVLAKVRARIEQTFSVFKQRYGWTRVRYFGLTKNTAHLWSICTACNLQRLALRLK